MSGGLPAAMRRVELDDVLVFRDQGDLNGDVRMLSFEGFLERGERRYSVTLENPEVERDRFLGLCRRRQDGETASRQEYEE